MLTTEKVGKRIYVIGDTYPIKDKLKNEGAHWDNDRKAWWIGAGKESAIQHIINPPVGSTPVAPVEKNLDDLRVVGKANYKGRTYYALWYGYSEKYNGFRAHLSSLDNKIDFWCDASPNGQGDDSLMAVIVKTYASREYRGRTEYTTLGSLKRFIEGQKSSESKGLEACAECGKRSGDLHLDLEDGMMKCYSCCDIPQ